MLIQVTRKHQEVSRSLLHGHGHLYLLTTCITISVTGPALARYAQPRDSNPIAIHSCGECGKCFDRQSALIMHQRVHTGDKPYQCELCGKRFTQKGNMKSHMLTHVVIK